MSRIGRLPVPLPQGVEVEIKGNEVTVKGPRGGLRQGFHPDMSIAIKDGNLIVTRPGEDRIHRALHGLTRSLLANMVVGVTKGFEKLLEIDGIGYRAQKAQDKLILRLGFSHPVEFSSPPGISITVEGNRLRVSGNDKQLVGEVAAKIRSIHPPDRYKGKGIRYVTERLHLKPGKAAAAKKAK